MELIADIRNALAPVTTGDATTYRCVDCLAEYDERRQLCPKCGGEEISRT